MGYGRLNLNITHLQLNCTGLMFILAAVEVYRVVYVSFSAFVVLVVKF